MTLPNNPFSAPSGVPQPSQEPAEASSLPAPASAPVMVAPAADRYGAAPLHTGAVSSARPSRSTRGRIGAWTVIVLQAISLVHGFIPYDFEHLDAYSRTLSNPMFWFWRLMFIIVIALAVLYLRKGAVIARYVAACIILVLFFIVTPVMHIIHDVVWYYAFVPDPRMSELGAVGARVILMQVLLRPDTSRFRRRRPRGLPPRRRPRPRPLRQRPRQVLPRPSNRSGGVKKRGA